MIVKETIIREYNTKNYEAVGGELTVIGGAIDIRGSGRLLRDGVPVDLSGIEVDRQSARLADEESQYVPYQWYTLGATHDPPLHVTAQNTKPLVYDVAFNCHVVNESGINAAFDVQFIVNGGPLPNSPRTQSLNVVAGSKTTISILDQCTLSNGNAIMVQVRADVACRLSVKKAVLTASGIG